MAVVRRVICPTGPPMRLVALIACALLLAGCSDAPSREEPTPTRIPLPVVPAKPTYEVQRGEVVKTLEFRGRIVPVVEEELFFRASGYIDVVYVSRDGWIQAGDLLAELETTDLKNQLTQARTDLEALQLDVEQRRAEAEANLRIAELRLARSRASDPHPQVVIAEAGVERAQIALADAQTSYQETVDRPWLPDPQKALEAASRQVREAELNLKVAEAQFQQAVQSCYYDVQILEQEVALARLRLQEIEAGLDLQRAELVVRRLEDQIADTQVVAPFDGQVMLVVIAEGRAVDAYRRVIVIGDPSELEVRADLSASVMTDIAEGMSVVVDITNRPGEGVQGHIRRVPYGSGEGGEADGSVRVALEAQASGSTFKLGDTVRVTVVLESKDAVLWVPPQAIRTFEGRDFVVVQEGEVQRRVDVKLGVEGEARVEIEEGLTEGQFVVGQ